MTGDRAGADAPSTPSAGSSSIGVGPLAGRRFFCSWSGGKDAYLALQRAVAAGGRPGALLCMLHEGGTHSRGHGLPLSLLQEQAAALGVPLVTRSATWPGYEATFIGALEELRAAGIEAGVFGDIDLQGHREWVERVCGTAGLSCHLPLWQEPRSLLVDELLGDEVIAVIVAVDAERLDASFVGRQLSPDTIADLVAAGADACGEEGEYHTVVTSAPLFTRPVQLRWTGRELRDGHHVLTYCATSA